MSEAVEAELALLGADGALASVALALAQDIDDPGTSATARAQAAKVLQGVMDRVRELSPPRVEGDAVDEIAQRRAERFAAQGP